MFEFISDLRWIFGTTASLWCLYEELFIRVFNELCHDWNHKTRLKAQNSSEPLWRLVFRLIYWVHEWNKHNWRCFTAGGQTVWSQFVIWGWGWRVTVLTDPIKNLWMCVVGVLASHCKCVIISVFSLFHLKRLSVRKWILFVRKQQQTAL